MNNQIDQNTEPQIHSQNNGTRKENSGLKSFSRLLIGTIILGMEELSDRMNKWEQITRGSANMSISEIVKDEGQSDNFVKSRVLIQDSVKSNDISDNIQFGLIGLIIDSQTRIQASSHILMPISSTINRFTRPFINTLSRLPVVSPIQKRYASLVERGEEELNRLILLGRIEYEKSHQMAEIAIDETFDEAVDYLATNKEIQELIQSQGVGLAGEVVDEIRERAVSADNFIDNIVRSLLKRKPRSKIPPPQYGIKSGKTRSTELS